MSFIKKVTFVLSSILLCLALILSCSESSTNTTSGGDGRGACSSHGGVSCSAGADSDGSVICNDGWEDSSVSYSDVCN